MKTLRTLLASVLPPPVFAALLSAYHFSISWFAALWYGYPARSILVIAVTGTKGKTSVTEMVNAILERAGHTTALMNSVRFKRGKDSRPNLTRMSTPGRFFIQQFIHDAIHAGCTAVILEMTSEGARQHRHRFIDFDALIFTNLAPEHIESHGSYEAYSNAKFEIGLQLARSQKRPRIIVANLDDKESGRYLTLPVEDVVPFSLSECKPFSADEHGGTFTLENTPITIHFPGEFSLKNALAATLLARRLGIPIATIRDALEKMKDVPGRAERIEAGQDFTVVVDYAHTPDSLLALYDAYKNVRKICVVSATGGGRDTWKRPVMGRIASEHCDEVIVTDEDPYDEDPRQIANDVAHGMTKPPTILMDRREAIRAALQRARGGDAVLITGKGSDPSICGPRGTTLPWSDARIVHEELATLMKEKAV